MKIPGGFYKIVRVGARFQAWHSVHQLGGK